MGYEKREWQDDVTELDKDFFDHIQDGIVNAHKRLDEAKDDVTLFKVENGILYVSYDNGETWRTVGALKTLETVNGVEMKFFVGTEEEYNALPLEEQVNTYAIITDENTQKLYSIAFDSVPITNRTLLQLPKLPSGKTVNDIVGVGIEMDFGTENKTERLSAGKTLRGLIDTDTSSDTYGKIVVPFYATNFDLDAIGAFGLTKVVFRLCSENDNLYLYFLAGNFYRYAKKDSGEIVFRPDISTDLTNGTSTLSRVTYWFA